MKSLTLLALAFLCSVSVRGEDAPATFPVGDLVFKRPVEWAWVPVNSPMRKAQLKVPGSTPEQSADITFFHFGAGSGGDVQANIQRWMAQFKGAEGASKVEEKEIAGSKVTLATTEGTFNSGMPGGPTTPMKDYALLGAIIEHSGGNVFVKMTGPTAVVKGAREKFMEFITTALSTKN